MFMHTVGKWHPVIVKIRSVLRCTNFTPYADLSLRATVSTSSSGSASECFVRPKKILFFGTDDFSLATLQRLHKCMLKRRSHHDSGEEHKCFAKQTGVVKLELCTSQMKHFIQPVKVYAERENLVVHQWPPDPINVIKAGGFDMGIIASFGHLIPKKIIEAFPLGMLNVHASVLPRWRGAAPITHAILAGDKETGISIMEVKPHHFDIGNILATERVGISADQTKEELTSVLARIGADLLVNVLNDLECYRRQSFAQDESKVTYAPRIDISSYNVDWNSSTSQDVYNQSRALSGSGKLYSTWKDSDVIVRFSGCVKPEVVQGLNVKAENESDVKPGRVVYVKTRSPVNNDGQSSNVACKNRRFICIKCKSGWIAFDQFYYGSNKVMSALDFYNGYISHYRTRPQYFT